MNNNEIEKRKFIRIHTVFPVEFRLIDNTNRPISGWIQGFSRDVGKGGICLFVNVISWIFWDKIKNNKCRVELIIHLPFSSLAINALASVSWAEKLVSKGEGRFYAGLSFLKIKGKDRWQLLKFAYGKKILPKLGIAVFVLILALYTHALYKQNKIVANNQKVVKELTEVLEDVSLKRQFLEQNKVVSRLLENKVNVLNQRVNSTLKEISEWKDKYRVLENQKKGLSQEELSSQGIPDRQKQAELKISILQDRLDALRLENESLRLKSEKLQSLSQRSQESLRHTLEKKEHLTGAAVKDMYKWIKVHQNLRTGLIGSFEGDPSLSGWGFTYDQALCLNVFVFFKDYVAAKRILDFYLTRAKKDKGGFLNAYYIDTGSPCEYVVHCGPNIWLGLGVLSYAEATGDDSYLCIAEDIAEFVLSIQDKEGGIKGGPAVNWYSTEHNLDAYSFFNYLYRLTAKPEYQTAGTKIRDWLKLYSYTNQDIPIYRGKGDSAIATDTYTWSLASLGPSLLESMDMDPDAIIEFAMQNCKVDTFFIKAGKRVSVEGFDFARLRNQARGGVISCEWSAQMVLSLKILARFHKDNFEFDKSKYYSDISSYYLEELGKMIISSPSPTGQGRGCLPYASQGAVNTGHGWRTPEGNDTCSVAATAYYIFAQTGYNPLNPELLSGYDKEKDE